MFDNQKKSKSLTPIVISNLSLLLGKTKILDKIKCKIHIDNIWNNHSIFSSKFLLDEIIIKT